MGEREGWVGEGGRARGRGEGNRGVEEEGGRDKRGDSKALSIGLGDMGHPAPQGLH